MLLDSPLVHVVEDDPGTQEEIRHLLTRSGYEVACFRGSREFLEGYRPRHPQCVLLDVFLPFMSGLELQRRLHETSPDLPVILLTAEASTQTVLKAFRQGAEDFLEKPWEPEELLDTVGRAIEKDRRRSALSLERDAARARLARLSAREREVFERIVRGCSSKAVAAELHLSKRTVDFHRGGLMRKLEASSLAELVQLARTAEAVRESA